MDKSARLKSERKALVQIRDGKDKFFHQITTQAINNVNAFMIPLVDEAGLSDEHAELMNCWKNDLKGLINLLSNKAEVRIIEIDEYFDKLKDIVG